jgi:hypothetical protein
VTEAAKRSGWLTRWRWLLVLIPLVAVFVWFNNRHSLADAIDRDFHASGGKVVDLPKSVPFAWSRVCILGPYSGTRQTSALLGFEWDSDAHSAIKQHDGVLLLVFATDTLVVGAADYSRVLDAWAGKCYPRSQARFVL